MEINEKEQNSKERAFVWKTILLSTAAVILLLACGYIWLNHRSEWTANMAQNAANQGHYTRAMQLAEKAETYGAEDVLNAVSLQQAMALYESGDYDAAEDAFTDLGAYENAESMVLACRYKKAEAMEAQGSFEEAANLYTAATGYEDALSRRDGCVYAMAEQAQAGGDYTLAAELYLDAASVENATQRADECLYLQAEQLLNENKMQEAFSAFLSLGDYSDAGARAISVAKEITGETDEQAALSIASGYTPEQWAARQEYEQLRLSVERGTVDAGWDHAVALKSDGKVLTAGDDAYGQCQTVGWSDIVSVGAGARHTVGLKSDGSVVATGDNTYGQCDVAEWKDITAIAVGDWDTYGLKKDGTIAHCGFSVDDVITGWNGIRAISAQGISLGAVRSGGKVLVNFASADCEAWNAIEELAVGTGWVAGITDEGNICTFGCDEVPWSNILALNGSSTVLGGLTVDGRVETLVLMPQGKTLATALSAETEVSAFAVSATWAIVKKTDGTFTCVGTDDGKPDVSGWMSR